MAVEEPRPLLLPRASCPLASFPSPETFLYLSHLPPCFCFPQVARRGVVVVTVVT
jgi:hypothetical protein